MRWDIRKRDFQCPVFGCYRSGIIPLQVVSLSSKQSAESSGHRRCGKGVPHLPIVKVHRFPVRIVARIKSAAVELEFFAKHEL